MRVVLNNIKEEALENVHRRHERLTRATHAAVKAMGLKRVAPDAPADSAPGIFLPDGIDGRKLVKFIRDNMGVTLAGGQNQWKGKIVRIAHLGYIDTFDIIIAVSALEMALKKMGHDVALGKGVAAAQEIPLEGF